MLRISKSLIVRKLKKSNCEKTKNFTIIKKKTLTMTKPKLRQNKK